MGGWPFCEMVPRRSICAQGRSGVAAELEVIPESMKRWSEALIFVGKGQGTAAVCEVHHSNLKAR